MMRLIKILAITFLFCGSMALAEEPAVASQTSTVETELKQELAVRDSVMQEQGNACFVEKDSLRAVIETEKAKSENWEKSYNVVKKNNEVCAQMLSTSIGVNVNKKEKEDNDRRAAALATSSSFLGGVGIGLLIMWLIMK